MDDVVKQGWIKESSPKYCFILRMDYIICFVLNDMIHREPMIPFPFFPEIWANQKGQSGGDTHLESHFSGLLSDVI